MNPTKRYECGECRSVWDTEDEAEICCPTPINDVYECGHCEKVWQDINNATLCCTPALRAQQPAADAGEEEA